MKKLKNFLFPKHILEILKKAKKASGKSETSIVLDGTLKECKRILRELGDQR